MINGFFSILQDDLALVGKAFSKMPEKQPEKNKVYLAALRIFGSLLMGSAVVSTFYAIPILVSPTGVWHVVTIVGNYLLGHDLFVISTNMTKLQKDPDHSKIITNALKEDATKERVAKLILKDTLLPIWTPLQSFWLERSCRFIVAQ